MKMKNMIAVLSASALSAVCFAGMSFSASAGDVVGIASLNGQMGTYQKWDQEGSATIDGNAQYEAVWDITGDGTGSIEFLILEIKGSDPSNEEKTNFTKDQYPDLNVTIDEICIDGTVYDFAANDDAVNLSYYEDNGRARIYLTDTWNVNKPGNLGVQTAVTQQIKVKFTVSGLYEDGTSNVTENIPPVETDAPATDAPTEAPATTAAPAAAATTAAPAAGAKTTTAAAAKTTTTTNAATGDTTGIALIAAGLAVAGAAAVVSRKRK